MNSFTFEHLDTNSNGDVSDAATIRASNTERHRRRTSRVRWADEGENGGRLATGEDDGGLEDLIQAFQSLQSSFQSLQPSQRAEFVRRTGLAQGLAQSADVDPVSSLVLASDPGAGAQGVAAASSRTTTNRDTMMQPSVVSRPTGSVPQEVTAPLNSQPTSPLRIGSVGSRDGETQAAGPAATNNNAQVTGQARNGVNFTQGPNFRRDRRSNGDHFSSASESLSGTELSHASSVAHDQTGDAIADNE